jgi:hypothetical protein
MPRVRRFRVRVTFVALFAGLVALVMFGGGQTAREGPVCAPTLSDDLVGRGPNAATVVARLRNPMGGRRRWRFPCVLLFLACALAAGVPELARAATPTAYAWGANSSGQLGDGTTSQQSLPVPLSGTPKLVQVSASEDFTVALDSQGNAWAWGSNASGQLGNGTYNDSDVPVPVTMPPGVTFTAIAANAGGCCRGHVLAVDSTGKLWGWGADDYNDNGTGSATNVPQPNTAAPPGVSFKAVGAGADAGYAVASDGTPYGWGDNADGAVNFPSGVKFTTISGGCDVGWGLDASGQAYAFGTDYPGSGVLGTGGSGPGKVVMPTGVTFKSISPAYCDSSFTVALAPCVQ